MAGRRPELAHKTPHRKRIEADNKAKSAARAEELAATDPASLKPNAAARLASVGKRKAPKP